MPLEQALTNKEETIKNTIYITKAKLPVCCPPKDQAHWNQHPRVYLEISKLGKVDCPYCGNHFVLQKD